MKTKSYIADNKKLMLEWDLGHNIDLDPQKTGRNSNKKAWWKCSKCGYEWQAQINNRSRGAGCPCCSKRAFIPGVNDLATVYPEIAKDWHPTKNGTLMPNNIGRSASKKVWWKCHKCGYEWQTTVSGRTSSVSKCPMCIGRVLVPGKNDLATKYPGLATEWHPTKNEQIAPINVMPGTHTKYWWKCSKCGHAWQASPNNRTTHNSICPQCSINTYAIEGVNDLATTHPGLAKEWHPTKNGNLTPQKCRYGSSRKVWWLCPNCGRDYQASIYGRVMGSGCRRCIHTNHTSYPEQALFHYIQQVYPDAINRYKTDWLGRMELDIFIPSLNYAIEYDGSRWHTKSTIKQEQKKYALCHDHNITLLRVREEISELGTDIADREIGVVTKDGKPCLEATIIEVVRFINFSLKRVSINLKQDELNIREKYLCKPRDSLQNKYPEIAKQWHPEKNGQITPDMVKPGSEIKVWWKCSKCGYEWHSSIKHKTRTKKATCPACSNQVLIPGRNDLATTHPELAKEWHPTKNGDVTPNNIITGNGRKYWWKCSKCGYEWQATITHRKFSNSGCPDCYKSRRHKSHA